MAQPHNKPRQNDSEVKKRPRTGNLLAEIWMFDIHVTNEIRKTRNYFDKTCQYIKGEAAQKAGAMLERTKTHELINA